VLHQLANADAVGVFRHSGCAQAKRQNEGKDHSGCFFHKWFLLSFFDLSKRRPFPSGRAALMNLVFSSGAVLTDGRARKKEHKKVKAQSVKLLRGVLNRIANRHHAGIAMAGYGLRVQTAFHLDPAFLSIYVSSLPPLFEKSSPYPRKNNDCTILFPLD
jgi:hypothetical protein